MEILERLITTYLANAAWMTCFIAATAMLLAKWVRRGPSGYRHALWVMAIVFASLIPLATLRNGLKDDTANSYGVTNISSIFVADGTSSPHAFAFEKRLHQRTVFLAPALTRLIAAVYLMFVICRGLALGWAWHRTDLLLRGARYQVLSARESETLVRRCSGLRLEEVSIALSRNLISPVIIGVRRPLLMLPEWFFSEASDDELVSAVSHELAHVRRHDFFLNLVQELLFVPISFHPAARFIKSQIERSRELACDEIAAARLPSRAVYARSLVSIAQTIAAMHPARRTLYALGLLSTDTLEERILNLLRKRNHSDKTWGFAQTMIASCLFTAVCLMASLFSIQVTRAGRAVAELRQFAGTWEGKFKGKTFVDLKLVAKDGKIAGTVSKLDIQIDSSGMLTDAAGLAGEDLISETTPEGRTLHLNTGAKGHVVTITGESDESIQYDVRLTGTDQAELQIARVPAGTPRPAPWKLERKRAAL